MHSDRHWNTFAGGWLYRPMPVSLQQLRMSSRLGNSTCRRRGLGVISTRRANMVPEIDLSFRSVPRSRKDKLKMAAQDGSQSVIGTDKWMPLFGPPLARA